MVSSFCTIRSWRYINDEQATYALRIIQCQLHGNLTTHGVTQNTDLLKFLACNKFQHIICHDRVIHGSRMGRLAMISKVKSVYPKIPCQFPGVPVPVFQIPKQSVQN